jgi:hypothetical protein
MKDHKKVIARREEKSHRELSAVPCDADEYLKAFLEDNKSNNKEFKLAALVIEDAEGHK